MKKLFKIGWVVLIIGLLALAIGYFNGGNKTISFNGTRPVVIKNHVRHLSTNKQFDQLDLDASTANVVIKQGKKYQVTYYGMGGQIPTANLADKKLTVNQKNKALEVLFDVNGYNQDLIVVTVPKGHALSGKIHLASGDLEVSNVDMTGTKVKVSEGDVDYDHVTLADGKTTLSEGDFTGKRLIVKGHYTVNNDEGDNTVTATDVEGYHLYTSNGENELKGQDKGDQTLDQNETAANVLVLTTSEGDNEVN